MGDLDAADGKGHAGFKLFVINVGVDLRLVDTKTLVVVDVISYQKQIIGREVSAGVFDFANGNIFDVGVGERAMEPIQLAVRSDHRTRCPRDDRQPLRRGERRSVRRPGRRCARHDHAGTLITGKAFVLPNGAIVPTATSAQIRTAGMPIATPGVKAAIRGRKSLRRDPRG